MFKTQPSSDKSDQNKTSSFHALLALLLLLTNILEGPCLFTIFFPNLPLTPQPSTIWLPLYHFTETALTRVTLVELKRLEMLCRHRPLLLNLHPQGLAHSRNWIYYCIIVLAGALFHWLLLNCLLLLHRLPPSSPHYISTTLALVS